MVEITPEAAQLFLQTMQSAGLNPTEFAVLFAIENNRLKFNFTHDTFFAKKQYGIMVVDELHDVDVVVVADEIKGKKGIIIQEKV